MNNEIVQESLMLKVALPLAIIVCIVATILILVRIYVIRKRKRLRHVHQAPGGIAKSSPLLDEMNMVEKNFSYMSTNCIATNVKEIPIEFVTFQGCIGEGAFGKVYKGTLTDSSTVPEQIAIKVLKTEATSEVIEDFHREVNIISSFDHKNILKLLGITGKTEENFPFMIFEYMVHGDLSELLRQQDSVMRQSAEVLTLNRNDLVQIATEVASGMVYLSNQHFVHRDLATRNCLVGNNLVVKISDFGMSRDVYTNDYYKVGGSRMLPVRWMAPESIKYGRFTTESDIWSFGVVLWEILSFGRQPYFGNSNDEVISFLDKGVLLRMPQECPTELYQIMKSCWKRDPKDRESFENLYLTLLEFSNNLRTTTCSIENPLYHTTSR